MTIESLSLEAIRSWYDSLDRVHGDLPSKGAVAVGLIMLERLKTDFNLELKSHLAKGGAQISGVSGSAVQNLLASFGETRVLAKIGGRTNRGAPQQAETLLEALRPLKLENVDLELRVALLKSMQRFLVERVADFHARACIKPTYNDQQSTRSFVSHILECAAAAGKRGPVAQYFVGAKLQRRFPTAAIRNDISSAPDDQTGQPGDFVVGDTVFHVTVAPSLGHMDQCRRNLDQGRRVYVLVPEDVVYATRQMASLVDPSRIAVESIESFVAQNIEELATFDRDALGVELARLLSTYNDRVSAVDPDRSLLVEIPTNLLE